MVCNRCITAVKQELEHQGLHPTKVTLGEAVLEEKEIATDRLQKLDHALLEMGFQRIDDRKARLIEAIKNRIIQVIHHSDKVDLKVNWSTLLADEFHYEYNYLSNLFSGFEGITIEQYIIRQKIEKVKELLFYDELTLGEIAHRLGYSSISHLSSQFKKVTGLTPSELKKQRNTGDRKSLDAVSDDQ